MRYNMSNYDKPQLRYSCFSEHSLVSHSHPRSLTLTDEFILGTFYKCHFYSDIFRNTSILLNETVHTLFIRALPPPPFLFFIRN